MHWNAPTEKDNLSATLEKRRWDAADQFRANSGLKAQEYSGPILGLIFLRFAEVRLPPNEPSWNRPAPVPGAVAESTNPPPTMPKAGCT